ncbi:MAG TPA: pseudouridine synthase [Bacillota bacterium]|nr:pseudouridine synthase [Bacillota bacterium]
MERLQKVLAARGVASRRKCEEMILSGNVKVNGTVISELGFKVNPEQDRIEVDGRIVGETEHVYVLFHKPTGVITSMKDPEGRKIVTDFMKNVPARVFPVGRLDYDTSGLLLLTNDGELANQIAHPRFEIDKVYMATVKGMPTERSMSILRRGVRLSDGMTAPAQAVIETKDLHKNQVVIRLAIHEGRNRQVRRMCEAIGHPVLKLRRVQLGFLTLGSLRPGEFRYLKKEEVDKLRNLFTNQ